MKKIAERLSADYISNTQQLPAIAGMTGKYLFENRVIVVLDDDPTGVQTVHGVNVFTELSEQTLFEAFSSEEKLFFILTNSRSLSREKTRILHENIALWIDKASTAIRRDYIIVSRSDSTLRGHWPLETEILRETIEKCGHKKFDGEIICPFFKEGGRYTIDNVHYVQEGKELVVASLTEFARDVSFGYKNAYLPAWCEEKSDGGYPSDSVICISLEELRNEDSGPTVSKLMSAHGFQKIIVNSTSYEDIQSFVYSLSQAVSLGREFIIRSAASIIRILSGIEETALLTSEEISDASNPNGGLVIVGSYVSKTTRQLKLLMESVQCEYLEFDPHVILVRDLVESEIDRISSLAEKAVSSGRTAVVFTSRERLDFDTSDKFKPLQFSVMISDALAEIVKKIKSRPSFIIVKGGITSSDIGTKALKVKKALVLGQVKPGIPVWKTDESSLFPGISYVVFPGNVGKDEDLREIVKDMLSRKQLSYFNSGS